MPTIDLTEKGQKQLSCVSILYSIFTVYLKMVENRNAVIVNCNCLKLPIWKLYRLFFYISAIVHNQTEISLVLIVQFL